MEHNLVPLGFWFTVLILSLVLQCPHFKTNTQPADGVNGRKLDKMTWNLEKMSFKFQQNDFGTEISGSPRTLASSTLLSMVRVPQDEFSLGEWPAVVA